MNYKKRLKRNISFAYLVNFFGALIFVVPIWVAFERRFLSFTQMAFLEVFSFGIMTFLELPTGALADLFGRRKTIILGGLLGGLANIYLAFASNISMFFLSFAVLGISEALISGSFIALAFDSLKELKKEDYFSKFNARIGLVFRSGLIIATFLGGYLYQYWVGLPFFLMGLMQIFSMLFIFLMVEPKIDTEKFSLNSYIRQTKDGFRELFKTSYMKKLTVYYTLVGGITWSCIYYFNQPFAKDFGFTEIQLSWLFSIIFLLSSLTIFFLVEKEGLLTRNRVYLGFPIIMTLSLLPGFFATKFLAPLLLLGVVFSSSARFSILDKYTNKEFLSKYRATAISSLNMLVNIFYIIVVGLGGKIQDLYNTKLIFSILGILTVFLVFPSSISLVREYKAYQLRKKNVR